MKSVCNLDHNKVSVPIGGLFNLTLFWSINEHEGERYLFPSPSGDYLILTRANLPEIWLGHLFSSFRPLMGII